MKKGVICALTTENFLDTMNKMFHLLRKKVKFNSDFKSDLLM